jgi:hypothetical protein
MTIIIIIIKLWRLLSTLKMDGALICETLLPDYTASQSTRYLQILFFLLSNNAVNCHHYILLLTHQWVCSTVQSTPQKNMSQCHLVQYRWPGWTRVSVVGGRRPTGRFTDIPIFFLLKYPVLRLHSLQDTYKRNPGFAMLSKPELQRRSCPSHRSSNLSKQTETLHSGANTQVDLIPTLRQLYYSPTTYTGSTLLELQVFYQNSQIHQL